jgi:hypothetical protein
MPANTPIFGFPYPLGTDPVSQGDNDIRDLAEDVETVISNQVGLWDIITCTVTSVGGTAATASNGTITIGTGNTSITVNNAFSNAYQSYRVIIENDSSNGTASHILQLQGITTSQYFTGGNFMSWGGTTVNGYGPAVTTNWIISANNVASTGTMMTLDIHGPHVTRRKYGSVMAQAGNGHSMFNLMCLSNNNATGFTLSKAGDTMTGGFIRVYGYRN